MAPDRLADARYSSTQRRRATVVTPAGSPQSALKSSRSARNHAQRGRSVRVRSDPDEVHSAAHSSITRNPPTRVTPAPLQRPESPSRQAPAMLKVRHGTTLIRLNNIDTTTRTVRDLQRIVAMQTKAPHSLHFFSINGVALKDNTNLTLQQMGLKSGETVDVEIRCSLTVISGELEMRFNKMNPVTCLVGQVRRAVSTRLNGMAPDEFLPRDPNVFREVVLQTNDASFISPGADDMTLAALHIQEGDTLFAIHKDVAIAQGLKEEAAIGWTTHPADRHNATAAYPKQANIVVRGKWPVDVNESLQLFVLTEGIWAGREGSGRHPLRQNGSVSKFPLPPVRKDATVYEVKKIIYDIVGVVPVAQVLFVEGVPLVGGRKGVDGDELRMFVGDGDTLQLAINKSQAGSDESSLRVIPSDTTPWCIHAVIGDGRVMTDPSKTYCGEWRPQFVQPSWLVEDLLAVICLEYDADSKLASIFYRGAELHLRSSLQECEMSEGSAVLVLLRPTMDVNIDVNLPTSQTQTLLRGVPPTATVHQIITKALLAVGVKMQADAVQASCDGVKLPQDCSIRGCGVVHRASLILTLKKPRGGVGTATIGRPVSPRSLGSDGDYPRSPSPVIVGRGHWPPQPNR